MTYPTITLHMATGNTFTIALRPDIAPNGVNSILELVAQKAYDSLAIQRIAPGFVLQPWYDEARMGPEFQYIMDGEFGTALSCDSLAFDKYTVGLGGDGCTCSSCGCFFIVIGDDCDQKLSGRFTTVGKVIDGFEEIERIIHVPTKEIDSGMDRVVVKEPVNAEIITSITANYNGYIPCQVKKRLP